MSTVVETAPASALSDNKVESCLSTVANCVADNAVVSAPPLVVSELTDAEATALTVAGRGVAESEAATLLGAIVANEDDTLARAALALTVAAARIVMGLINWPVLAVVAVVRSTSTVPTAVNAPCSPLIAALNTSLVTLPVAVAV